MKVKASKKQKTTDKKLVDIKKSKKDIQKSKKPKKELKSAALKAATSSVAAPLTFAEKKILSVKRKTKAAKAAPEPQTVSSAPKPKTTPVKAETSKKVKKGAKKTLAKIAAKTAAATDLPPLRNQKNSAEEDKKAIKKRNKKARAKKNKAQNKGDKPPPKPRETGPIATEVTEEVLALVPKQLISAANFKVLFEHMKKKAGEEDKNRLFSDDMKYGLQITAVKIPQYPARNCRITLPHSLLRQEDDTCLIVMDMVRGLKDYQETLNTWEDKLREAGVSGVTQIIPFQQLKQDYGSFEMKLKLVHRFQRFLVDSRVSGHVFSFLGKTFTVRGKNPIAVKLEQRGTIKDNIEKAMRKETYRLSNVGKQMEIKFAAHWMSAEVATANGMALLEALKQVYPGGWLNIQSLYLTTACNQKQSFPLYMSNIDPNLVPVPSTVGPREKFIAKQNAKVRASTGGKFELTADGLLKKVRNPRVVETDEPKPALPDTPMETGEGNPAEDDDEANESAEEAGGSDAVDDQEEPSEDDE